MEIASNLILHFIDARTVKNQLPFVYKAPSLWYFCYTNPNVLKCLKTKKETKSHMSTNGNI